MNQVSQETNTLLQLEQTPIGLIIDESSHEKKGEKSVGVAKQYCGSKGKIENCQVAVYAAYSTGNYYGLSDCELFLPKVWVEDKKRCEKAGIPTEKIVHKSKPQLALEMVKRQVELGNQIDFVGSDGLYGNDYSLMNGLDELGLTGVFRCTSGPARIFRKTKYSHTRHKRRQRKNGDKVQNSLRSN